MELQGSLKTVPFGDVVQMLEARHSTGVLRLENGEGASCQIYLREGRIVHVAGPNGSASRLMLSEMFDWESLPGARFEFDSNVPSGPESLTVSNASLLMEAALAKDAITHFRQKSNR